MTIQRVVDLRDAARQIQAARARYPLAMARLWHRDPPRTSQRTAFTIDLADMMHCVLGGMGSGKTEGAIQVAAAMARGRDDLEVRVWAAANGFPLARIPPKPSIVIVSAGTHQLSNATLRPLFARYMPAGTEYKCWQADKMEAQAALPNGCRVRLMAATQPLDQWQSMAANFALLDEEHAELIVDSALQRTTRTSWPGSAGWVLLSATPATVLKNPDMAWMHERLAVRKLDGYQMRHIHGSDNPHLDRDARERLYETMSASRRGLEDRGEWYNPGGMVFDRFDRAIHVVAPHRIPSDWQRLGGLDLGTAAPTAYLASAYDPGKDQLHIYGGYYGRNSDQAVHASGIHALHAQLGDPLPSMILADLNTPDAMEMAIAYHDQGIALRPADKAFEAGIAAVSNRMEVRQRGRDRVEVPGLVIHDHPSVAPLLTEIPMFAWRQHHIKGGASKATHGADHACDVLRYLCHYLWIARRAR